ncbi:hypothetical protein IAT38_002862 [Cryptococcus sp. DSM 104549]
MATPLSKEALWSTGQDETVEVNQRALIDKILARYSGEHTIFRELMQNSDDAGAEHVQIKFYTEQGQAALKEGKEPSDLPDLEKDQIHSYIVCNDGMAFRPEDWQRLKKIAEGNPDEEKIGAFGVGFYSLFSVCDGPFVESGDKWMAFYWKDGKDQLMARSGALPPAPSAKPTLTGNPWTTFTMALREPTLLEGPLDLARFFITSITFMRTVRKIDMLVDGIPVLEVEKGVQAKNRVAKKGMKTTSGGGMMTVTGVDATGMVITAKIMKWLSDSGFTPPPLPNPIAQLAKPARGLASMISTSFFGRYTTSPAPPPEEAPAPPPVVEDNPKEVTTLMREIHIYEAAIQVRVSPTYARELERATKKAAPARMSASLVFSRGEEKEEAKTLDGKAPSRDIGGVFSGLCPKLDSDKSARVFIGQPTGQTTGIGGHLSARFIPTVERESVDLVDRHVSVWNRQLLWVGGYLSRLIYELEMQELQQAWSKMTVGEEHKAEREKILARALHVLRFFSFKPTTPSAVVGQEMESAFYDSVTDNRTMAMLSIGGILPVSDVRMPNPEIAKFLPELPVVTPSALQEASRSIARLRERSLLVDVTYDDVVRQLAKRPLTEQEATNCLLWWQSLASTPGFNIGLRSRLLDAAIVACDNDKIIPLSSVQTFIRPHSGTIPNDMPVPPHTIPYTLTKDLKANSIYPIFGWTELNLVQYTTFLITPPMSRASTSNPETDIRVSPAFAEKALAMLGRAWTNLAANQQSAIALELKDVACIPTKMGIKQPHEAYFEKNLLFDDLPTIALPKGTAIKGGMEKMLLAIGVRRTVNLQLVFSRLVGGGEWSCHDLMRYLVSVRDTLSEEELKRLRQTAAFPLAIEAPGDGTKPALVRQKPWQLYEPTETMKALGLPLLDWGDAKWRSNSEEAKMLFSLGLNRFPAIDTLLSIAAGRAPANAKALEYLLANIQTHYPMFKADLYPGVAFIPAVTPSGESILARPGEAFTNPDCALLGFSIVDRRISTAEAVAKLGIQRDPPMGQLVISLLNRVPTLTGNVPQVRKIFEYMGTLVGQGPPAALDRLREAAFIPAKHTESSPSMLYKPSQVFFVSKDHGDDIWKTAFTFVDFGSQANVFLRHCGVRPEPSVRDIAALLVKDPEGILKQAGSPGKYLTQLRVIATNWNRLDTYTKSAMKSARFLLAWQLVPRVKKTGLSLSWGEKNSGEEENEWDRDWVLAKAGDIVINDSVQFAQHFGQYILAAPEEQILEDFYLGLGAKPLSTFVKSQYVAGPLISCVPTAEAQALRRHVLERLTIFFSAKRRTQTSSYTIEGLSKEGNFTVREVQSLKVQLVYRNGRVEKQHHETMYASADAVGQGIVLTVSASAPEDEFDIASGLCAVLFKSYGADDAMLLQSMLTTSLMALRKRGFNVERILNQQREDRLRAQAERQEQKEAQAEKEKAAQAAARESGGTMVRASEEDDGSSVMSGSTTESGKKGGLFSKFKRNSMSKIKNGSGSTARGESELDKALKEIQARGQAKGTAGWPGLNGMLGGAGGASGASGGLANGGGMGMGNGGHVAGGHRHPTSTPRPTDMANIRRTVQTAIDASRPETATQIGDSRQAVGSVSESQSDYCDTTAQVDLVLAYGANQPNGPPLSIWVPREIPDHAGFLKDKLETCLRFSTEILLPICEVFSLRPSVMNVFWNLEGPTIAFNRSGTVYCNGRYFEAWHNEMCKQGNREDAFISWYFSVAHELAHNLESAHNASHEFYFSSIAEEYLMRFYSICHAPPLVDVSDHHSIPGAFV